MAITNATSPLPPHLPLPLPASVPATPASDMPFGPDGAERSQAPLTAADEAAPPHAATDLMTRVVRGAHDTIDRLAEHAAPQLQRLDEGLGSAGAALHDPSAQWRETADAWADTLRCTVRENPLAAVAGAVALGLLIARVTR